MVLATMDNQESSKIYQSWDDVYSNHLLEELPWVSEEIHPALKEAIDSLQITSGNALDVGCGTGQVARYLAAKGFDTTAIDISREAIRVATCLSEHYNIDYKVEDSLSYTTTKRFNLIVDFLHFHHIQDDDVKKYLVNISRILEANGLFLLTFFEKTNSGVNSSNKRKSNYSAGDVQLYDRHDLSDIILPFLNGKISIVSDLTVGRGDETYDAIMVKVRRSQ